MPSCGAGWARPRSTATLNPLQSLRHGRIGLTHAAEQNMRTWKPVADWPAARRPAGLWSFIAEAGSLTERLKAKAGAAFRVQLLHQGHFTPSEEEMMLLDAKPEEAGFERQVYLCGRAPLVYA